MAIAQKIRAALSSSSIIRKMFEEGIVLKKIYGSDKVYDFSLGNPDIEPPERFGEVLRDIGTRIPLESHGYMPNAGFVDVRRQVAKKVSIEQGVTVDEQHIVMAAGAAGGLNVVFKAILNPDSEVIVPRPYFLEYRSYIANHGGRLVEAAVTADFNLDIDAIAGALSPATTAVLINSPNNPSGRVYSAETLRALAGLLAAHGKKTGVYPYLIADEPYREIVYDGICVPPVLSAYRNAVVVSSYSKSLSAGGERIGYIAVGPELEDKAEFFNALVYTTRTLGFVNASALMQRCVGALAGEYFNLSSIYERRRAVFMTTLDNAGIEYIKPEGTFYIFAKVPARTALGEAETGNDGAFVEHLKQERILSVPGGSFGAPGWVRFAYCVDENLIERSAPAFQRALASWRAAAALSINCTA